MNTILASLGSMLMLVALAATPLATQSVAPAHASSAAAQVRLASLAAPGPASIDAELDEAERLLATGRFREAGRRYARAAQQQQENRSSAAEALWKLAEIQYGAGKRFGAARTFDRVELEAQRFGDPVTQARALIEAATLYYHSGEREAAAARLQRLELILPSPYIPNDVRSAIERRIDRG